VHAIRQRDQGHVHLDLHHAAPQPLLVRRLGLTDVLGGLGILAVLVRRRSRLQKQ
jgi:hypothetical protein